VACGPHRADASCQAFLCVVPQTNCDVYWYGLLPEHFAAARRRQPFSPPAPPSPFSRLVKPLLDICNLSAFNRTVSPHIRAQKIRTCAFLPAHAVRGNIPRSLRLTCCNLPPLPRTPATPTPPHPPTLPAPHPPPPPLHLTHALLTLMAALATGRGGCGQISTARCMRCGNSHSTSRSTRGLYLRFR